MHFLVRCVVAFLSFSSSVKAGGADSLGLPDFLSPHGRFGGTVDNASEVEASLSPGAPYRQKSTRRLDDWYCPKNIAGQIGYNAVKTVVQVGLMKANPFFGFFYATSYSDAIMSTCGDGELSMSDVIDTIMTFLDYVDDQLIIRHLDSVDDLLNGAKNRLDEFWNPSEGETQLEILNDLETHFFKPLSQKLEMNATNDGTSFLGTAFGSWNSYPEPWSKLENIEGAYNKQHMYMLYSDMTFEAMNLHLSFLVLKTVFWKDDVDTCNDNLRMYWNFANTYGHYLTYLFVEMYESDWRGDYLSSGSCTSMNDESSCSWGCHETVCSQIQCVISDELLCMGDPDCDKEVVMTKNGTVTIDWGDDCDDEPENTYKNECIDEYIDGDRLDVLDKIDSQLEMLHDFNKRIFAMHSVALKWFYTDDDGEEVEGCMGFSEVSSGAYSEMSDCAAVPDQQFVIDVVDVEHTSYSDSGLGNYRPVVVIRSRVYQNLVLTPESNHEKGWYGTHKLLEYVEDQYQQWILLANGLMMNRKTYTEGASSYDWLCVANSGDMGLYRCEWDTLHYKMTPIFEVTMNDTSFLSAVSGNHWYRLQSEADESFCIGAWPVNDASHDNKRVIMSSCEREWDQMWQARLQSIDEDGFPVFFFSLDGVDNLSLKPKECSSGSVVRTNLFDYYDDSCTSCIYPDAFKWKLSQGKLMNVECDNLCLAIEDDGSATVADSQNVVIIECDFDNELDRTDDAKKMLFFSQIW